MTEIRENIIMLVISIIILSNLLFVLPNFISLIGHADYNAASAYIVVLGLSIIIIASCFFYSRKLFVIILVIGFCLCNLLFLFILIRDSWYIYTIEDMLGFIIFHNIFYLFIYIVKLLLIQFRKKKSFD
jgi:hypothetical protein